MTIAAGVFLAIATVSQGCAIWYAIRSLHKRLKTLEVMKK